MHVTHSFFRLKELWHLHIHYTLVVVVLIPKNTSVLLIDHSNQYKRDAFVRVELYDDEVIYPGWIFMWSEFNADVTNGFVYSS